MLSCTRRVEFDAGHRVFGHQGKCRYPHGHRYVVETTVTSPDLNELGMVVDFGDVKTICQRIVDFYDHGFLVFKEDVELINAFGRLSDQKLVVTQFNPTAENIAQELLRLFQKALAPLSVYRVRVYETPNCWADAYALQD